MRDTHVNLQAAYALAALACNTPRRTMGAMDTYRKWLVRVGAAIRHLREDRKMTQVSLALEVEVVGGRRAHLGCSIALSERAPDDDEEPDQEHQGHSQPEHGRLLSATRHHNTKKFLSVCA